MVVPAVISRNPGGLPILELPSKFKSLHGTEFDYANFGCVSLSGFCMLLPGIFDMERISNGWVLFPPGTRQKQGEQNVICPEEKAQKLRNMVSSYSSGVQISHQCLQ